MEEQKVSGSYFMNENGEKIFVEDEHFNKVKSGFKTVKKTPKKDPVQKVSITVAWSDILKIRERIKLITLLGIVFAFVGFAQTTIFAGLGLEIMLTGIFILVFGIFYVLNEKQSEILKLKIAGKIKSTFKGVKQ
jgi:hypothetical protein